MPCCYSADCRRHITIINEEVTLRLNARVTSFDFDVMVRISLQIRPLRLRRAWGNLRLFHETFVYFIVLVGEVVAFYEYLGIAYSGNVDIIGCT